MSFAGQLAAFRAAHPEVEVADGIVEYAERNGFPRVSDLIGKLEFA